MSRLTEQEAINILQLNTPFVASKETNQAVDMAIDALEKQSMVNDILNELQQYRTIGSVEELKALKEKAKSRKPNGRYKTAHTWDAGYCPVCDCGITSRWSYCQECGQHIDWSK